MWWIGFCWALHMGEHWQIASIHELPRRGLLGNRASGKRPSRKLISPARSGCLGASKYVVLHHLTWEGGETSSHGSAELRVVDFREITGGRCATLRVLRGGRVRGL